MNRVTDDIFYIGVNDHDLDLFEGQYIVPLGMAYNSYVILDEKIAVMDSVEKHFGEEWLASLDEVLSGRTPDYLIVQHMEPDHSANIALFTDRFPAAVVVASAKAFTMMKNFYGSDYADRRIVAADGTELSLGTHVLQFVAAPMVHWPEVLMTYDRTDKVLFSADAFGKFGALDREDPEGWACEARRYYFGIVGKYGAQAQAVLKKAAALDIRAICPLHGPVLNEDLPYYLDLYNTWTTYGVETEGVAVFYTSVYGNTEKAVRILEEKLKEKGCPKVAVSDLARDDMAECVEDAFRYGKVVLATTTYNADIFPFMRTFIETLTEHGFRGRKIGLIENGSWAPVAAKVMKGLLEGCKDTVFAENSVKLLSSVSEENLSQIDALADEMLK
jgi:flavorubredoxin